MSRLVEVLAQKITEGFQSSSIIGDFNGVNLFHRNVVAHESQNISFISGLVSTGLRGSVQVNGDDLISNYNQLLVAYRQHLPVVIQTTSDSLDNDGFSVLNCFDNVHIVRQIGCPQFVASNQKEHIALTLIAHRVAELALTPVIVIKNYLDKNESETLEYPNDKLIVEYLGASDDQIDSPSPSQEIIFGKKRRKVPNWFSLDSPLMLGEHKTEELLTYENAANQEYFNAHLDDLILRAFDEFNAMFKNNLSQVKSIGNFETALISAGTKLNSLTDGIDNGKQITRINLLQINPFPVMNIQKIIKGKKAISVLEHIGKYVLADETSKLIDSSTKLYRVKHNNQIESGSIERVIEHMLTNQDKTDYYLEIEFTKNSDYPKHDILLNNIKKAYPGIEEKSITSYKKTETVQAQQNTNLPNAIRFYSDQGPKYTHLSRFYDDTALFFENEEFTELVADPFNAVSVTPAATANFHRTKAKMIPVFDSQACTGCGDCFIHCPHSAIPPIAIGVEQLVRAAAQIATNQGASISKLTPLMKNLAKVAGKAMDNMGIYTAGDCLKLAFDKLVTQMKLEGEKLDVIKTEFNTVLAIVSEFSVSKTDVFFNTPNAVEAGTGELFSLAINPNACTGCGVCSEVCEVDALPIENRSTETFDKALEQFNLWEQLPDTTGETINRLYKDKDYNSIAAMLLSRSYYMSMTNAGPSDRDVSYKTLLHLITSSVEFLVQPKILDKINYINGLINSLTENIHSKLSGALPTENFETISKSLKTSLGRKLSLKDVVNKISNEDQGQVIDVSKLSRKIDLLEMLNQLKWVLSEGPTGIGRSRFGLLISDSESFSWARKYPHNNFVSPVIIQWKGSAVEQIIGLFHGQLRYLLDNIKLLRRAELEIKDKYDTGIHDEELISLSWEDLTDKEKEMVPPLILVGERKELNDVGWTRLNKILANKWPIKIFLLDNAISSNQSNIEADLSQSTSAILGMISLKNAFVFQGNICNSNHLFDGVLNGLHSPHPALFNLFSAKTDKHVSKHIDWMPLASLASNSRAFPVLKYDPQHSEGLMSGGISLEGNADKEINWFSEKITIPEHEVVDYTITWADWAYSQKNWINEFSLIKENDNNISVADYIELAPKSRSNKTPVIMRHSKEGIIYYLVSEKVIKMTQIVLNNWNTLQEIAGISGKLPQKLRENVVQEQQAKYETEIAQLKNKHEKELLDLERKQTEFVKQKLKEKLVALSAMQKLSD